MLCINHTPRYDSELWINRKIMKHMDRSLIMVGLLLKWAPWGSWGLGLHQNTDVVMKEPRLAARDSMRKKKMHTVKVYLMTVSGNVMNDSRSMELLHAYLGTSALHNRTRKAPAKSGNKTVQTPSHANPSKTFWLMLQTNKHTNPGKNITSCLQVKK